MQSELIRQLSEDLHPPLTPHEALVESDRCYFCHDAPCVQACPTGIDIPLFIRQINTKNPKGSAKTIFNENIFGGMCARVCPTETLCEQRCVRQTAEDQPVKIGLLQRYATDTLMQTGEHPFTRAKATKRKVAVVGAGPAGLACAHRLAMHGHNVTVLEARSQSGGLNEHGIASYKSIDNFAQREIQYILSIGGIEIKHQQQLGQDFTLASLKSSYDAVFLGVGLSAVNQLNIKGSDLQQVEDAVQFIEQLRQSDDVSSLPIGQQVVVIGGGMTAIDAAVQAKMLGAEEVTVVYRRSQQHMAASEFEQHLAQTHGVVLRHFLQPVVFHGTDGAVTSVEFEITEDAEGPLQGTGNTRTLACDHVLKAVGQAFNNDGLSALTLHNNRIQVDSEQRTSDARVWAGGDCCSEGEDLTVTAVQAGKVAAESIHLALTGAQK